MRAAKMTAPPSGDRTIRGDPETSGVSPRIRHSPPPGEAERQGISSDGGSLRIAILGRRQLCGDCLHHLFERQLTHCETRIVASVDEVSAAFGENRPPHIVVMSTICAYGADTTALRELCAQLAPWPVLVHADVFDAATIRQIVDAGAKGVLPTWLPPRIAGMVLQLIAAGETYVPSLDSAPAPQTASGNIAARHLISRLTPRQISVLRLATEGKSNKEIGRALGLGPNTIKFHVASLMDKLGVDNRVRLAVMASRLLPP